MPHCSYFAFFMVAQTWYGFGVGGEYPMAASSAAEHSTTSPELSALRGRQVTLVFSNQVSRPSSQHAALMIMTMMIAKSTWQLASGYEAMRL